jgi:hypothetical protein
MTNKEEQRKRLVYCVDGEEIQREAAIIDALSAAEDFRETKNPVYGMQSYVSSLHLGIKPPENISDWIGKCFLDCLETRGEASMDRLMGLVVGPGGTPPFEAAALRMRDTKLFTRILQLTCHGAKIGEAVKMVCALFREKLDHDGPAIGSEVLSEETVAKQYGKWNLRQAKEEIYRQQVLPLMTAETVASLLCEYPEYSVPDHMKPLLRHSP